MEAGGRWFESSHPDHIGATRRTADDWAWRSLVAHLSGGQEAAGSNPAAQTTTEQSAVVQWQNAWLLTRIWRFESSPRSPTAARLSHPAAILGNRSRKRTQRAREQALVGSGYAEAQPGYQRGPLDSAARFASPIGAMEARHSLKVQMLGSIPAWGAKVAIAQLAERMFYTHEAAGSIPASHTTIPQAPLV